jgi:serine/threonine protein kinase/WD40 repeat protein
MSVTDEPCNQFDIVAEEFAERFRRGERPTVNEYANRHPELADEIRELFPALIMMEEADVDSPRSESAASPSVNGAPLERLGDFRIIREVGRGGMGVVYEAVQESLGRHVALKVLPVDPRNQGVQSDRFRREAHVAARLHHSNIVPVHGIGLVSGLHYYAMQFIHGGGLDAVLRDIRRYRKAQESTFGDESAKTNSEAPVTNSMGGGASTSFATIAAEPFHRYYRSVASLGVQAADALAYAHSQNVIHRDINPSNLLLDDQGTLWIADFGLAKADDGDDLTQTGDIVGTLRFIAPERFAGVTDARGDIYSLGITLYEMLTLRPAFDDSDRVRLIRHITQEEPRRPTSIDARVPNDLETIVLKAIAKEPSRRYQTAKELSDDLQRFLADRPIHARRTTTREQVWRWCRRNPTSAGFAAVALSLLAALAVISTIAAIVFRDQRNETRQAERDTRLETGKALLAEGTANMRTGLMGQRFETLELFRRAQEIFRADERGADYLPELRDQVICALGLTDLHKRSERAIPPSMGVAFDGSLERYAAVERATNETVIRAMSDGRQLMRLPTAQLPFYYAQPIFSSDGSRLAVLYALRNVGGLQLEVWNLNPKEKVLSVRAECTAVAFHTDNRQIIYVPVPLQAVVWDLVERKEVRRIALTAEPRSFAIDSSGRRLAVDAHTFDRQGRVQSPQLRILSIESGEELAAWYDDVGDSCLAWSADGRLIAGGNGSGHVYVRDVESKRLACVFQGHTNRVTECHFANTGHLLATCSWDGTTKLWDAASGRLLTNARWSSVQFSTNGQRLGYVIGEKIGECELAHDQECFNLCPKLFADPGPRNVGMSGILSADFSHDDHLLAVSSVGGVELFDTVTGAAVAHLSAGDCGTVLFHPDDRSILTCDVRGLCRWPIDGAVSGGRLHVGAPKVILDATGKEASCRQMVWIPGSAVLAVAHQIGQSVRLLDFSGLDDQPTTQRDLASRYSRMINLAVSPDGRWLASGGWKEQGIQVWNLAENKMEQFLRPTDRVGDMHYWVAFAPNGRLMTVVNCNEKIDLCTFEGASWERKTFADLSAAMRFGPPVFSRDGRLMAFPVSPRQVRIADPVSGRTYAHLTVPDQLDPVPMTFSRDGSRLAVSTNRGTLQIWNLKMLHRELADWNLAWPETP